MSRSSPRRIPKLVAALALIAGCEGAPVEAIDAAVADTAPAPRDVAARSDVTVPQGVPLGGACAADRSCDDGVFCNGVERCVGARCVAGRDPCDDGVRCTLDRCDEAEGRCARTLDGARCADDDRCNGEERCDPTDPTADPVSGCTRPAQSIDCNDGDPCTIDTCSATQGCVHAPRDLDGDGHVDRACPRDARPGSALGDDCDDRDPGVHPQVTERCDDQRDNNCDGLVDHADALACRPENGACSRARALALDADGALAWGTTAAFTPTPALPCVDAPVTRGTAWFRLTLDAPGDLALRLEDGARGDEVPGAIALLRGCDDAAPRCASGARASDAGAGADPELSAQGLSAGEWLVAVQTASARPFSLRIARRHPRDGGAP